MTFARVFTGLDRQATRSNVEEVHSTKGKTLGKAGQFLRPPGMLQYPIDMSRFAQAELEGLTPVTTAGL